jgi:hypothetical protein
MFATLGAVENHPDREIVAEIFKAMSHAGGNEQQIGFAKGFAYLAADKFTAAARDDVNFVLSVRRLRIAAARRINFNQQTPMRKHGKRGEPSLVKPTGVELGGRFGEGL